jgi:hypothetical protein
MYIITNITDHLVRIAAILAIMPVSTVTHISQSDVMQSRFTLKIFLGEIKGNMYYRQRIIYVKRRFDFWCFNATFNNISPSTSYMLVLSTGLIPSSSNFPSTSKLSYYFYIINTYVRYNNLHSLQYFSYIMATSLSGGGSRRESPTMGKQLINFITCGCE